MTSFRLSYARTTVEIWDHSGKMIFDVSMVVLAASESVRCVDRMLDEGFAFASEAVRVVGRGG